MIIIKCIQIKSQALNIKEQNSLKLIEKSLKIQIQKVFNY